MKNIFIAILKVIVKLLLIWRWFFNIEIKLYINRHTFLQGLEPLCAESAVYFARRLCADPATKGNSELWKIWGSGELEDGRREPGGGETSPLAVAFKVFWRGPSSILQPPSSSCLPRSSRHADRTFRCHWGSQWILWRLHDWWIVAPRRGCNSGIQKISRGKKGYNRRYSLLQLCVNWGGCEPNGMLFPVAEIMKIIPIKCANHKSYLWQLKGVLKRFPSTFGRTINSKTNFQRATLWTRLGPLEPTPLRDHNKISPLLLYDFFSSFSTFFAGCFSWHF